MNTRVIRAGVLVLVAAISGCASHYSPDVVSDPYGFISGIWHGMVFPYALCTNIVSWSMALLGFSFLDSIQIIGRPNTGFWYYAGFALGLSAYGGGAAR